MLRRFRKTALALLVSALVILSVGALSTALAAEAAFPADSNHTKDLWNFVVGSGGWENGVSAPCLAGDYLVTMAGEKVYFLDKTTGEEVKSLNTIGGNYYSLTQAAYYEGKVFVASMKTDENWNNTGYVQVFDTENDFALLGTFELGIGQPVSKITVWEEGGEIYFSTGLFKGEGTASSYLCFGLASAGEDKTVTVTEPRWKFDYISGFYNVGAAVVDNYLLLGTDDGTAEGTASESSLLAINKITGTLSGSYQCTGDIRCTIAYADGRAYFTSKAGYAYSVGFDSEEGVLNGDNAQAQKYGDSSVSDAVLCDITGTALTYGSEPDAENAVMLTMTDENYATHLICVDASDITNVLSDTALTYSTKSTPVVAKDGSTYRAYYETYLLPGEVRMVTYGDGLDTEGTDSELFLPRRNEQYASMSIIGDPETGYLYYKNDSGYLYCLTEDPDYSYQPWNITGLEVVKVNERNAYDGFAKGAVSGSSYSFSGLTKSAKYANLWLRPEDDYAAITVTKVSGVSKISAPAPRDMWAVYTEQRYAIYYSDIFTPAKVKVTVTAEDGTVKSYTVTLKKFTDSQYTTVKNVRAKAVTGLKAKRLSKTTTKLSWKKVSGATGYKVYRATKKNGKYTLVKTVKGSGVTSAKLTVKKGKNYYYKVRAYVTYSGYTAYSKYSAKVYK